MCKVTFFLIEKVQLGKKIDRKNRSFLAHQIIKLPDMLQIWTMDFYKYLLILSSVYQ